MVPTGVPFTWKVTLPAPVPGATEITKSLLCVGVTLESVNEMQMTPDGREAAHERVTG